MKRRKPGSASYRQAREALPTRPEIDKAWAEEAERRVAEIERGEVEPRPIEEVFERIGKKPQG